MTLNWKAIGGKLLVWALAIGVPALAIYLGGSFLVAFAMHRLVEVPELGPLAGFHLHARETSPVVLQQAKVVPTKGRHAWKLKPRPAALPAVPVWVPSKPEDATALDAKFGTHLGPSTDPATGVVTPPSEDLIKGGELPAAPWGGTELCTVPRDGSPGRIVHKPNPEPTLGFFEMVAIGGSTSFDTKGKLVAAELHVPRVDLVRWHRLVVTGAPSLLWDQQAGTRFAFTVGADLRFGKHGAATF